MIPDPYQLPPIYRPQGTAPGNAPGTAPGTAPGNAPVNAPVNAPTISFTHWLHACMDSKHTGGVACCVLPPQVEVAFKVLLESPLAGEAPHGCGQEGVVIMVEALDEAQPATSKSVLDNEVFKASHEGMPVDGLCRGVLSWCVVVVCCHGV